MTEEKKTPKEEIEMLCKSLLRLANEMSLARRVLTKYMNRHSLYLTGYLLGVGIMLVFRTSFWLTLLFLLLSVLIFGLSSMYTERLHSYIKQYRTTHKNAVEVVSKIIEIVDWGELRKQQYYKGTSENVSQAIRVYYDETQMAMSPGRNGREYCIIILISQIIIRYACFLLSIYAFISGLV